MITLATKQEIILEVLGGASQREIARKHHIGRNTIRKYVREYEESRNQLLNQSVNPTDIPKLISNIIEKPKYNASTRTKKKLTSKVMKLIHMYLEQNEEKRYKGLHKQQMKAVDIHEELIKEGFEISYTTVAGAVRKILGSSKEAYIKQEYTLGDVCEFDWGEVKLSIEDDTIKSYQMAVFTSAKGNFRYAKLYNSQKMECFLDVHTKFFNHIEGVYKTVVYDNMKTAVKKFVTRTSKEPTEDLLKLSLYYGFKYRFCNTYSGNEKGHVERSVEYIRRKVFAGKDHFTSLEEANTYLLNRLEDINQISKKEYNGKCPYEILKEEKAYLLPIMPDYECARVTEARVDKYSTITVDQNRYSVPDDFVGQFITVFIYPDIILCYKENKEVAKHQRNYGNHQWSLCISHYAKTMSRKPGSIDNSLALKQADQRLQNIFNNYYISKPKDFIALLEYISVVGETKVYQAIDSLMKISPIDLSTDKIKFICSRNIENSNASQGDEKIIAFSKKNIERINRMFGIKTTEFKGEDIV